MRGAGLANHGGDSMRLWQGVYSPLVESAVTSLSNTGWPALDSRSSWKFVTYRVCYHRVPHLTGQLFSAYLLGPHSVS